MGRSLKCRLPGMPCRDRVDVPVAHMHTYVHAHVSARAHTHTHSMGKKGACCEEGNQPEDRESSGVVLDSLLLLSVSSLYSAVRHGGEIKAAGARNSAHKHL